MEINVSISADDACLVYPEDDLEIHSSNHANYRLELESDWCPYEKLSLNPTKYKYMLISNNRVEVSPKIKLHNDVLECVSNNRYLVRPKKIFGYLYLKIDI